jgi:hypothetical protein
MDCPDIDRIACDIVVEMKRNGLNGASLVRHRGHIPGPHPPREFCKLAARTEARADIEARKAIERVRLIPDLDLSGIPTEAELHAAGQGLDEAVKLAGPLMPPHEVEAIKWWRDNYLLGAWREPPPRFHATKWWCAKEAFDLVRLWTNKAPTGYEAGPFRRISVLIHEAMTGEVEADLKRQCDAVLKKQKELEEKQRAAARKNPK